MNNLNSDKYILWDVILRKEFFWWLIYNLKIKNYKQINKDAYLILRLLNKPLSRDEIILNLKYNGLKIENIDLDNFLTHFLIDSEIIKYNWNNHKTKSMMFFDNIEFENMRTDHLNFPTNVSIYITQRCPKTCKHCVTRANPNAPCDDELNKEQWINVLKNIRKNWWTTIVFSWGEPMIKEWIFDIIEEADKLNLSILLLSDFDWINEEIVNRIKNLKNLEDFQISLDWASNETHDWIRWNGSFQKAMYRMNLLKKAWIKYTVSTVIHKKNLPELDKIVKLVKELWATYHYVSPLSPYGRWKIMDKFLLSEEELKILWQSYIKYISEWTIKSRNAYWINNVDKVNDADFSPFKKSLTLISNWFYNFSIKWQWDCYLDSKLWSDKILKLWNILEDDLLNIWNNPILDKIRWTYKENKSIYINQENLNNYI